MKKNKVVLKTIAVAVIVISVFTSFYFYTYPFIGLGVTASICLLFVLGALYGIYLMRPRN